MPAFIDGKAVTGQDSLYVSAVIDKSTGDVIIKVVNASVNTINKTIAITGAKKLSANGTVTVLKSNSLQDVNSFAAPQMVSPVTATVTVNSGKLNAVLPANSFSVYRVAIQ